MPDLERGLVLPRGARWSAESVSPGQLDAQNTLGERSQAGEDGVVQINDANCALSLAVANHAGRDLSVSEVRDRDLGLHRDRFDRRTHRRRTEVDALSWRSVVGRKPNECARRKS